MVDPVQRPVPVPQVEVAVHSALRRKVLRQRLPLAARPQHVEDAVQHLALVDRPLTTAPLRRRDQRRYQRPLGIAHVARITKAGAIGGAAVFGLPHWALSLRKCDRHTESQPTLTTQDVFGSALSDKKGLNSNAQTGGHQG